MLIPVSSITIDARLWIQRTLHSQKVRIHKENRKIRAERVDSCLTRNNRLEIKIDLPSRFDITERRTREYSQII